MSVLHVALFKWNSDVSAGQVSAFEKTLATMPTAVGLLKSFHFGRDLGQREGNFDYGVVAELDSADHIHDYLDHPAHQQLVRDHVQAMLRERKAVQFELQQTALPGAADSLASTTLDCQENR